MHTHTHTRHYIYYIYIQYIRRMFVIKSMKEDLALRSFSLHAAQAGVLQAAAPAAPETAGFQRLAAGDALEIHQNSSELDLMCIFISSLKAHHPCSLDATNCYAFPLHAVLLSDVTFLRPRSSRTWSFRRWIFCLGQTGSQVAHEGTGRAKC